MIKKNLKEKKGKIIWDCREKESKKGRGGPHHEITPPLIETVACLGKYKVPIIESDVKLKPIRESPRNRAAKRKKNSRTRERALELMNTKEK